MSFLQPILLIGLPLALLPVIIHLINQHRHRTVKWAAMLFLLDAKKMTKGIARLRQILILAMRVIAIAALVFAASRPLAGGWLALTGGKADTVLILLDRSASMEQQNLETGTSKRVAALEKIADLIEKTGKGSEIILIDSATLAATPIADVASLADIPQTSPTATTADFPALFQKALEYLRTDASGRTDIWVASDLRQSDWDTGDGQWQLIRSELSARETVRLFLLTYPEVESDNVAVSVSQVAKRSSSGADQLIMDLTLRRPPGEGGETEVTVPVEITINGTRTIEEMTISGEETQRLGFVVPLSADDKEGWGRIDLPADENLSDNAAFFVFGDPAIRKTVIVSDDPTTGDAIRAAAVSGVEPGIRYDAEILSPSRTSTIPWSETALIFWHAPLPAEESAEAALLRQHVESGRSLVLLPPDNPSGESLFDFRWGDTITKESQPLDLGWWRTETGLLANTRSGSPLPVSDLTLFQVRLFDGETQPLLRLESGESVITKLVTEGRGNAYAWGTLPRSDFSTLASDGIAFFVMIHRAIAEGANAVSRAQTRPSSTNAIPERERAETIATAASDDSLTEPTLLPSAWSIPLSDGGRRLVALNRPQREDDLRVVADEALTPLLEGVEFRQISDQVDSGSSLASEIWKAFLIAMALALLAEAALCLPPVPEQRDERLRREHPAVGNP